MNEIIQRSPEWFTARLGKVTASKVADVMAKTKTGYAASRETYATQLVLERITKTKAEGFTSQAMQWGIDQEPFALAAYQIYCGWDTQTVGFVPHPTIEMAGASPDALVDDDGLVEIKCPESKGMIETLLSQKVPSKYFAQIQFQLACTGRKWADYCVFDPRMPEKAQLFVARIFRDDRYIAEIEAEIVKFLAEVNSQVKQLTDYIENRP
jgi:putative phage-type endonuclease